MRKITILLAMLTLFVDSMMAQQVSVSEAMSRAQAFLQSSSTSQAKSDVTTGASSKLNLAYTCQDKAEQKVCFYVFNSANGFVIVGGDETAKQILGYSNNGTFDYATAPENFKWWLSQYQQQISDAMEYVESHPQSLAKGLSGESMLAESSVKTDIAPLLTTTWDQDKPFNNAINAAFYSQTNKTADLATGCVATAMAQVLYHHKDITKGSGSATGTERSIVIDGTSYTWTPNVTFLADYDWNNMLTSYPSDEYNNTQADAVATLMYHAGVAVDMKYGESSGASMQEIPNAFASHFGYDKSIRHESREYFTDTEWENMIYNELSKNGPVIYGGDATNGNGGHCFICDGYKASDNTFHIDWGWSGSYDNYFVLTGTENVLKPNGSGTGGSGANASYANNQEAIINVKTISSNLETPTLYNYTNTLTLNDGTSDVTSYTHTHGDTKTLTLTGNVWNCSNTLTKFTLGIKATDTTTGLEYYFPNDKATTINLLYYNNFALTFDADELPYNGTYAIKMVGRNVNSTSDNDWYDVGAKPTVAIPTVVVTGATDPAKTNVDFEVQDNTVQVSRTLSITHTAGYNGNITYTSSNTSVATVDANGVIKGVAEGTATITATAAETTYFNETTKTFDITVTPFVKAEVTAEISATELTVGQTAYITITEGYDGTPSYEIGNNTVVTLIEGTITANTEGASVITVTLPETANFKGKTYTFTVNVSKAGLIFSKAPYFSNDNNPWSNDLVLHMPLYNGSSETFNGKLYVKVSLANAISTKIISLGGLSAGASYDLQQDLSGDIHNMQHDVAKTISFYYDEECTQPFNIPTITYTYRSTLSYDYEMSSANIGTIILPFDAEIPTKSNGGADITWKAYECNSISNGTLILTEATTLKRNTPYIITGDAVTCNFTGPYAIDSYTKPFGTGLLKGVLHENKYQFTTEDYILQNQEAGVKFYHYTADGVSWYAAPYRAFLQLGSYAKISYAALPNFGDDTPTAVTTVGGEAKAAGIYTIGGMRLHGLQPGLNIIVDEQGNTTKVFIKK